MEDNYDPGQPEQPDAPDPNSPEYTGAVRIQVDRVLQAAADMARVKFTIWDVPTGQAWKLFIFQGSDAEGWTLHSGSVTVRHGTDFEWLLPRDFHGRAVVLENPLGLTFVPPPSGVTDSRIRGQKSFRIDWEMPPPNPGEYAVYLD